MSKAPSSRFDRAKLRERQILDAAKECFARIGFHSTSMAQIAAQARMSVGQIYRHFRSKEALIEGIVKDDVSRQLAAMETSTEGGGLGMMTAPTRKRNPANAMEDTKHLALMLEIAAEAARNPKVREIILAQQRRGHAAMKKRMAEERPGAWAPDELDVRIRLASAITTGVILQITLDRRTPTPLLLQRATELTRQLLSLKA